MLVEAPGQSLAEFYAVVQQAASTCEFETATNVKDMEVTMVFIGGLPNLQETKKLLEKIDMLSKNALEVVEAYEMKGEKAPD